MSKKNLIKCYAKSTFEQINEEIFGNRLPKMRIIIKRKIKRKETFALYWKNKCWIFRDELKNCGEFLPHQVFAIVAHETIHHAQNFHKINKLNGFRNFSHNGAFFRHYARIMQNKYGHKIEAMQVRYE